MTNTPKQAETAARTQSKDGPQFGAGLCLQRCRLLYAVAAKYPDATTAWNNAKYRHRTVTAPAGTLLWWVGGSHGHGHVALSAGGGWCWSTDLKRSGYFDLVPVSEITRQWGMTFVGWSEDINGVRVIKVPRDTPWRRVRKQLLAALNSEDASKIGAKRIHVRAFLATVRAGIKALPRD